MVDAKRLNNCLESKAGFIVAPVKIKDEVLKNGGNKTWLFSHNPELAARQIKSEKVFPTPYKAEYQGIHPQANVSPKAKIGKGTTVGPNAFVGENCEIGENCFIGANTVIEKNCRLGNNTTIHPLAYIGHSCVIGNNCEIMPNTSIGTEGYGYAHDEKGNHYRIPHTGRVILEDDVHFGAGSSIDRGTITDSVIGRGTKVDNLVHFGHNIKIGKNGLITAQVGTAGSVTIGDNFIVGGNTAITGHVNIVDNVTVAGISGVNNDIRESGSYGGHPTVPLKQYLKVKASYVHVPELRKQVKKLMRKVFPEDN